MKPDTHIQAPCQSLRRAARSLLCVGLCAEDQGRDAPTHGRGVEAGVWRSEGLGINWPIESSSFAAVTNVSPSFPTEEAWRGIRSLVDVIRTAEPALFLFFCLMMADRAACDRADDGMMAGVVTSHTPYHGPL